MWHMMYGTMAHHSALQSIIILWSVCPLCTHYYCVASKYSIREDFLWSSVELHVEKCELQVRKCELQVENCELQV